MQVVIDISYKLYDSIHDKLNWNGDLEQKDIKALLLAVYNGIPLPQNHGDLKDMDDLCPKSKYGCKNCDYLHICNLYDTPTVVKADKGDDND